MNTVKVNILGGKKFSKHVYLVAGTEVTVDPAGKGRPPLKRDIDGVEGTLVKILQFLPPVREPKALKVEVSTAGIKRTTVQGAVKKTVLVYSSGAQVEAAGGRPKLVLDGSPLVEVIQYLPGTGKKGRAPVPTVTVEVQANPGIAYVYGGIETRKPSGQRGAPAAVKNGAPLEKIIKYVLGEFAPKPYEPREEEAKPTMAELGWAVGDKVRLIGSALVADVVVVRDYHFGVRFPGNKFIDTFDLALLERVQ